MKNVLSLLVLSAVVTSVAISAEAVMVVPGDYAKTFTVTFPGYSGSTTLTDFPVLVRISKARNDFNYSACRVENGGDLRFADSSGNLLSSEVDTWNTSGESLVWVKVPSLDASTVITAYYGNANPPAVTPSDVWANGYVGVWHLNESAAPMAESSGVSTPFEATGYSSMATFAAAGVIGNSVDFAGHYAENPWNVRLQAADDDDFDGFMDFTVECWTYQEVFNTTVDYPGILAKRGGSGDYSWWVVQEKPNNVEDDPRTICYLSTNGTAISYSYSTPLVPTLGEWTHQAFVRNTSLERSKWYLNGSAGNEKTETNPQPLLASTGPLRLGGGSNNPVFPGSIDEVRISNVARSADWLKASHDCVKEADFAAYTAAENDWTVYSHKFKVSFTGYAGSETLTDFPVLVKVSESGISGFDYDDCLRPDGGDLRFSDEEGNLLASEVDTWDTNGVSLVWVKVPSLTAATTIMAYYGWSIAPAVAASNVWANGYVGVWHLNESVAPMAESSGVSTPFQEGSVVPGYATNGVIGKAVNFATNDSGTTDTRLEAADDDDLDGFEDFTVEYWTYQASFRSSGYASILAKRNGSGVGSQESWMVCQNDGTQYPACYIRPNDGGNRTDMSAGQRPAANQWTHQAYTRVMTSGKQYWYFDGASVANVTSGNRSTLLAGTATLKLGGGATQNSFPGSIDEVRISRVARSADWVKASHDTVTESAFAVYGAAKENGRKGMMIVFR